jgi:hypothetical protein
MSDWKIYTISEACKRFSSGKGITASQIFEIGAYPVFGGNGIRGYTDAYNFEGECAIIGRQGAYCGNTKYFCGKAYMTEHAIVATANDEHNIGYIANLLSIMNLGQYQGQSAQPGLSVNTLSKIELKLPDKKTQDSIFSLLSALDKKIALNKQINVRLEEMAKTLYDYWFVQFDFPDADGRPYKSSGGEMVFDETLKREIPKGWEVKSLGEIADLYQPATLSEKELNKNGQFLVYGANGIIGKYNKFNHENPVVAVACRGNSCGAINITQPKSWITGNAMVVNPKNKNMCIDFIKNTLLVNNLDKVVSGSAQPQITRTNFAPLKVILPSEALLKLYSDIVNSMFNKRINQIQQNAKLTQLRDFLLPMLMNGQVSVAE